MLFLLSLLLIILIAVLIGALALPKLVSQAIAANSAAIDGASGASMTTAGFKEAVAAALELAK